MGFSHRMPWAAGIRVELAAHSSAARRLVAVARIEIGWVKRIEPAASAGLADMVSDCSWCCFLRKIRFLAFSPPLQAGEKAKCFVRLWIRIFF